MMITEWGLAAAPVGHGLTHSVGVWSGRGVGKGGRSRVDDDAQLALAHSFGG